MQNFIVLKEAFYSMLMLCNEKPAEKAATEEAKALSRKKWKRAFRPTVAQLKTVAEHAEVVEMHDVCSHDAFLLVYFKGYRNAVPVPRHWLAKSKYLQRKRGIERPPFDPPAFIKATGIMEMREAVQEKACTQLHMHIHSHPAILFHFLSIQYI